MQEEFTRTKIAEQDPWMSIMLSWQQDMVLKMGKLSGISKTPGEINGEVLDTSRSSEERTCVP